MSKSSLKKFIIIAVVSALVFGLVYLFSQKASRQSADEPQIKIAEDSINSLRAGKTPEFLSAKLNATADLAKSLEPFLVVYNAEGKPMSFTATLNDKIPSPPDGTFAYAKEHGENRITWQPDKNLRIAAIVLYYSNRNGEGYVLAGQSLQETEKRSNSLKFMLFAAWLLTIIITFFILSKLVLKKKISSLLAKIKILKNK